MSEKERISIERAKTPESVGVSSAEVQAFIDQCMEENKQLHSFMVIRHGKVACEAYREPFAPQYKHMMYSVSKSFTSTAIAFAIEEGYITLDTKLLDVFLEARDKKLSPYVEKVTVKHLLNMTSGLNVSILMDKTKDNWFKEIVGGQWISEPGTEFLYISESMYLLCCIIQKVTGMSVVNFLKPRLFEPLGIVDPFWETDPRGIETGGWGLMITTEDLAKFTLCYQQGGKWNGKQIIPEYWTKEAVSFQADNSKVNTDLDSVEGYGYCFWRNGGCKNSWRADGMFSQFGIGFEDYDACFICTCGEVDEQAMRNTIWDHFPKAFIDEDPDAETQELSIPPYEKLPVKERSYLEKKLKDKTIKLSKPLILNAIGFPVSVVPLPAVFMEKDKAGNINNVSFNFLEDEMIFTWAEGDEVNSIHVGMDGEYRWDEIVIGGIKYNTCSIAAWNSETELEVRIRAIETVCERVLTFIFDDNSVVMKPSSLPSVSIMADTLKETVKSILPSPIIQNAASAAIPHIIPLIDFPHYGKIK